MQVVSIKAKWKQMDEAEAAAAEAKLIIDEAEAATENAQIAAVEAEEATEAEAAHDEGGGYDWMIEYQPSRKCGYCGSFSNWESSIHLLSKS